MATIEDFVYNRLTTTVNITAIVGTRVYRLRMPDNPTLPAITYQTISGQGIESVDGDSGLYMPTIGIDCWAMSAAVVQDLAYKVRAALLGYSGTYSDITISKILEWSHNDLYDVDTDIFHVAASCRVWYS
jgi:hypothetical protein